MTLRKDDAVCWLHETGIRTGTLVRSPGRSNYFDVYVDGKGSATQRVYRGEVLPICPESVEYLKAKAAYNVAYSAASKASYEARQEVMRQHEPTLSTLNEIAKELLKKVPRIG